MGRPLRALYANTTYSTGVQEMSDAEIADVIAPLILNYIVANPDTSYGSKVRTVGTDPYAVSRGSASDSINAAVGTHPSSNSSSTAGTIYQTQRTLTNSFSVRPVHYVMNGNEVQIQEMTDSDLNTYFYPSIVNTMLTGGVGAYFLGPTATGAPVTGTWSSYGTVNDTYYVGSTLTTVSHTLWQRTDAATVGTVRPLRYNTSGSNPVVYRLDEMQNSDIQALAAGVGEYIRTTGIGVYAFQPSAPGSGTWVSRGSFTDKINNLTDTSYAGAYVGSYANSFTGVYAGTFTGVFVGSYSRIWTGAFTGIYTATYTGNWTGAYAGSYQGNFSGSYAGTYSRLFTGSYTGNWTGTYTGAYIGFYAGSYTGSYQGFYAGAYAAAYAGSYAGSYQGSFTGSYQGFYASAYTGYWNVSYTAGAAWTTPYPQVYTGVYVRPSRGANFYFTGNWTGTGGSSSYTNNTWTRTAFKSYAGNVQRDTLGYDPFSGQPAYYTGYFAANFVGAYEGATYVSFFNTAIMHQRIIAYTGNYTGIYSRLFTGSYQGFYTGSYTGTYAGAYLGSYIGSYQGSYTGVYAGTYLGAYAGSYQGNFTGTFAGTYSSLFTGSYAGTYVGLYNTGYTGIYGGSFTTPYTGSYVGGYTSNFTGIYSGLFTGSYTGAYSGLTVQTATTSNIYTLWVRTA